LHGSEKKKPHNKKELKEAFILQKCLKHKNKKLEFFCVEDESKCCSHCLISDHEFHNIIPLSEAKQNLKTEISNVNFTQIHTNLKLDIHHFDNQIFLKKKELLDLESNKKSKVDILNSVQKIYESFESEEVIDTLISWKSFLSDNGASFKMKLFVCGKEHGIGLDQKINKFTEIDFFHEKKIDLISNGSFYTFVYSGKN
jgi:hypothetical protein